MPNIRILNWNIERVSANKLAIGNMAQNIGKVIATAHNPGGGVAPVGADVVIIEEIAMGTAVAVMTQISAAANAADAALGGGGNNYTGWLLSYPTGAECYGVLIRDLNVVRPIRVTAGPSGSNTPAPGNEDDPADPNASLNNLDRNQFATWPGTFAAMPNAYAGAGLPAPAARPQLPLTDIFAKTPPVGRKRKRFSGQTLASGGYALGRGFRMPCLIMLEIDTAAGPNYIVPILASHLGAVRGGANPLARGQFEQYRATHIAQKFRNTAAAALVNTNYIDLNGVATPIRELIITGDFNIDFTQQNPPLPANALRTGNRTAYNRATPTTVNGGSATPPPGAPPGSGPGPLGAAPAAVPFPGPFGDGPIYNNVNIPNQTLKTGNTRSGTILHHYPVPAPVGATTEDLRGANFDNFFYGGTQLSATAQNLTPMPAPANDCFVHDVPAQIVKAAPGPTQLNVNPIWINYVLAGTHNAFFAPNYNVFLGGALNLNDRLIGARFISDHLPILIQFNLP